MGLGVGLTRAVTTYTGMRAPAEHEDDYKGLKLVLSNPIEGLHPNRALIPWYGVDEDCDRELGCQADRGSMGTPAARLNVDHFDVGWVCVVADKLDLAFLQTEVSRVCACVRENNKGLHMGLGVAVSVDCV